MGKKGLRVVRGARAMKDSSTFASRAISANGLN
jgi:hypothetical protein